MIEARYKGERILCGRVRCSMCFGVVDDHGARLYEGFRWDKQKDEVSMRADTFARVRGPDHPLGDRRLPANKECAVRCPKCSVVSVVLIETSLDAL